MNVTIGIVEVVVVGLLVGVEFAVAVFVNPMLDRLPGTAGLAARTDGARVLGAVMPFWYIGSMALGVVWALTAGSWTAGAGAALLAVSVVISVTLLVPINDRVKTWVAGDAPADWRDQVHRWDRLHYARVAVIVAGLVLLTVALAK